MQGFYKTDSSNPVVRIESWDNDTGFPEYIRITHSHTMAVKEDNEVWTWISPYSFQNIFVPCNVFEPIYVGSQMDKVLLVHGVQTCKDKLENVQIPHLVLNRLRQCKFQVIKLDIRNGQGRPINFQTGRVTAALYFRKQRLA